MNDIDGKTTCDVGDIDRIDNSRRLKRLRHEINSKVFYYFMFFNYNILIFIKDFYYCSNEK